MRISATVAAVVTGGASGLGEATARHLASLGAQVGIMDMDAQRGEDVAGEIGGVFAKTDVSDAGDVDHGLEKLRAANGQERICVNCAGLVVGQKTASRDLRTGDVRPHAADAFQKIIDVNLVGSFIVGSRSAAGMMTLQPDLEGSRGVVVNTASIAAEDGQAGQAAYAASKGGVKAMTLPMARDLAREGIRVCAILPGLIATPMFDGLPEEARDALAASVPFPKRLGRPDEFARLVAHIVDNDLLNGAALRLDGALRLAPR